MTTKRTITIAAAGFAAAVGSVAFAALPGSAQENCPPKTVGTNPPLPCHATTTDDDHSTTTTTTTTTSTTSTTSTTRPGQTTTTDPTVQVPPVRATPNYTG